MEFVFQMLVRAVQRIADGDVEVWSTAWRTVRFAVLSTALALAVGLPLGVWMGEARTRGRRVALTLANAGLGLPPVVLGVFLAVAIQRSPRWGRS